MRRLGRTAYAATIILASAVVLSSCGFRVTSVQPALTDRPPKTTGRGPIVFKLEYGDAALTREELTNEDWARKRYERGRQRLKRLVAGSCAAAGYSPVLDADLVGDPRGTSADSSSAAGTSVVVRVAMFQEPKFSETSAVLTAYSLGLIPSWASWPACQVTTERYERRTRTASVTHTIRTREILHLVLLPVFWLNFVLPSDLDRVQTAVTQALAAP